MGIRAQRSANWRLLLSCCIFCIAATLVTPSAVADDETVRPPGQSNLAAPIIVVTQMPMSVTKTIVDGVKAAVARRAQHASQQSVPTVRLLEVNANEGKHRRQLKRLLQETPAPRGIIALGSGPCRLAHELARGIPIACLGMNVADPTLASSAKHVTYGVELQCAPITVIAALRRVLPHAERVGVLQYRKKPTTRGTTKRYGDIEVVTVTIRRRREVARAALRLLREVDVLWLQPTSALNDQETVRYLLGKALELGRPVIGLAENYVRAGALFCVQPDFTVVGEQLGELIQFPRPKTAIQKPRRTVLYVNAKLAHLLDISLSVALQKSKDVVVIE